MRILIAEDDPVLSKSVSSQFEKLGFVTDVAFDGVQAEILMKEQPYDLLILDLNMPKRDGNEVLCALRRGGNNTPTLVLTARDALDDKLKLFNHGADDYLTKPFRFEELEVRCRALIRRNRGLANDQIEHGDLLVDRQACSVSIHGQAVGLTQTEYRLLDLLLANIGKVLSKSVILDHLYHLDDAPNPSAVEIYVARLRKTLSESHSVKIRTLRGLGYVLEKTYE